MALWSRRADRLHEVAVVTAEFRAAAAAAVDDLGVPVRHLARVIDLSPRGMLRHVEAGREASTADGGHRQVNGDAAGLSAGTGGGHGGLWLRGHATHWPGYS
ncbi:MAG: hypothetical protein KTV45_15865 [Acidimicrobiia bacterium]|nr:hypothetical protein [Acidimicrobiia bacterium]